MSGSAVNPTYHIRQDLGQKPNAFGVFQHLLQFSVADSDREGISRIALYYVTVTTA